MRVKKNVFCKCGNAAFDIPRGGGFITGEQISEIALLIDKKTFVGKYGQCIPDRGIPVRMVLHTVADDVSNFMKLTVIHFKKRMQDTPLHRL